MTYNSLDYSDFIHRNFRLTICLLVGAFVVGGLLARGVLAAYQIFDWEKRGESKLRSLTIYLFLQNSSRQPTGDNPAIARRDRRSPGATGDHPAIIGKPGPSRRRMGAGLEYPAPTRRRLGKRENSKFSQIFFRRISSNAFSR